MATEMTAESLNAQVREDIQVVLRIQAEVEPYYFAVGSGESTDNATSETVMMDILRRYRDAWQELARM